MQNQELEAEPGNGQGGWLKVKTDTFAGFVNGSYLSDKKVEVVAEEKVEIVDAENSDQPVENKKASQPAKEETNTQNDAEKLTSIDGNNQLILVTSNGYSTSTANVQTFERNSDGD